MELVQTFSSLRGEEVNGPELTLVIVGELWIRIATGINNVNQGVPTGLEVVNVSPGV